MVIAEGPEPVVTSKLELVGQESWRPVLVTPWCVVGNVPTVA